MALLGLACDGSDPLETRPSNVSGSDRDAGPGVPADASSVTPGLDARVVLPIDDPDPIDDAAAVAPGDAAVRDGALSDAARPDDPTGVCGGLAGLACATDEFCSQEDAISSLGCGFADSTGSCLRRPRACPDLKRPVCGCDLKTYDSECKAHAAGASIAKLGECVPPKQVSCDERPGMVTCKRTRPSCPEGQVPAVVDSCWGECVAIEQCACADPDACPERETYVCHMSAGHCGPYVN